MTLVYVSLKLANKAAGRGAQPKHGPNPGHYPLDCADHCPENENFHKGKSELIWNKFKEEFGIVCERGVSLNPAITAVDR